MSDVAREVERIEEAVRDARRQRADDEKADALAKKLEERDAQVGSPQLLDIRSPSCLTYGPPPA